MPSYIYRAKKGPGEIIEAALEAQSEKEAIERINALGYTPISLTETGAPDEPPKQDKLTPYHGQKVRSRDITVFTRQLASLLKAGVPILNALNIISDQTESEALKAVVGDIFKAVKDGTSFSLVLERFPRIFPALYIALVRTGEESGSLPEALLRIAQYRAKEEESLSRLRMALAYPVLMTVVGIATVTFMLAFVIPRLAKIFYSMGQELPLVTKIVISVSTLLGKWWLWASVILAIAFLARIFASEAGRRISSRWILRLPLIGSIVLKADLARFSRTLELLMRSGLPVLKALDAASAVVENVILRESLRVSIKALERGGSFGRSLKEAEIIPAFMSNLVMVGEQSGKLNDSLAEVALSYEHDTEEALKIMTNLLEPVLILVMGLIVGFLVVAMLLPVFEMNALVK